MEHWKARLAFVDSQERFAYEILSGGKTIVTTRLAERNTSEIVTLIAAAPELLEACEGFVKQANKLSGFPEAYEPYLGALINARSAIKQAKGRI